MNPGNRTPLAALVMLALIAIAQSVQAADKALIVGVGEYSDRRIPSLTRAGIPEDIGMYTHIAEMMAIPQKNIRILRDEQATLARITAELKQLSQDVGPGDRVLFAYSGHGTHVPDTSNDEQDHRDEALVPHDARSWRNLLLDDDLDRLLGKINTSQLYVFIDACFSGSATRSFQFAENDFGMTDARPKVYFWPEAAELSQSWQTKPSHVPDARYLSFSASQDDQVSWGSGRGGVFTLSIYRQLRELHEGDIDLTPQQMINTARQDVSRWAGEDRQRLFRPVVNGPEAALNKSFALFAASPDTAGGDGPMWQKLVKLVELANKNSSGNSLDIDLNQLTFQINDVLSLGVYPRQSGYLNVISVDANDRATVLFPNDYHRDNHINAGGMLTIPSLLMPFDIRAADPVGSHLVVAFLSAQPIDLFELGIGPRSSEAAKYQAYRSPGLGVLESSVDSQALPSATVTRELSMIGLQQLESAKNYVVLPASADADASSGTGLSAGFIITSIH